MISRTNLKAFYQFLWVGLFGFGVDALIFFTVIHILNGSLALGRTFASFIAMSSTWLLNRSTTFANKRSANIFKEWTLYIFTSLIGALANFLTLSYVAQFDFALFHIPAYLGGTAIGLIINFLLYKIVVFKTSTD